MEKTLCLIHVTGSYLNGHREKEIRARDRTARVTRIVTESRWRVHVLLRIRSGGAGPVGVGVEVSHRLGVEPDAVVTPLRSPKRVLDLDGVASPPREPSEGGCVQSSRTDILLGRPSHHQNEWWRCRRLQDEQGSGQRRQKPCAPSGGKGGFDGCGHGRTGPPETAVAAEHARSLETVRRRDGEVEPTEHGLGHSDADCHMKNLGAGDPTAGLGAYPGGCPPCGYYGGGQGGSPDRRLDKAQRTAY